MWLSGLGISSCLSHSQSHTPLFSPPTLTSPIPIVTSYSRATLSVFSETTNTSVSFLTLISSSLLISITSASDMPLGFAFWVHSSVLGGGRTKTLFLSSTALSFALSCFMHPYSCSLARPVPRWVGRSVCKMPACALQHAPCKWLQSPICTECALCS